LLGFRPLPGGAGFSAGRAHNLLDLLSRVTLKKGVIMLKIALIAIVLMAGSVYAGDPTDGERALPVVEQEVVQKEQDPQSLHNGQEIEKSNGMGAGALWAGYQMAMMEDVGGLCWFCGDAWIDLFWWMRH